MAKGPGERAFEQWMRKMVGFVGLLQAYAAQKEGEMKENAPWQDRTGIARQSLQAGVEVTEDLGRITLYFQHGVEYGQFLEEGSPPHEIRPRDKKALYWPGADHPVRRVQHPGSKAYPIVQPTAEGAVPEVRALIERWFR